MDIKDLFEYNYKDPISTDKNGVSFTLCTTNVHLTVPLFIDHLNDDAVVLLPLFPYGNNCSNRLGLPDFSDVVYYAAERNSRFRVVVDKSVHVGDDAVDRSSSYKVTFRVNYGVQKDGQLDDVSLKYWIHEKDESPRLTNPRRIFPDGRLRVSFSDDKNPTYSDNNFLCGVNLFDGGKLRFCVDGSNQVRFEGGGDKLFSESTIDDYKRFSLPGEAFVKEVCLAETLYDPRHRAQLKLERKLDFATSFANLVSLINRFYIPKEMFEKVASLDYLVLK